MVSLNSFSRQSNSLTYLKFFKELSRSFQFCMVFTYLKSKFWAKGKMTPYSSSALLLNISLNTWDVEKIFVIELRCSEHVDTSLTILDRSSNVSSVNGMKLLWTWLYETWRWSNINLSILALITIWFTSSHKFDGLVLENYSLLLMISLNMKSGSNDP